MIIKQILIAFHFADLNGEEKNINEKHKSLFSCCKFRHRKCHKRTTTMTRRKYCTSRSRAVEKKNAFCCIKSSVKNGWNARENSRILSTNGSLPAGQGGRCFVTTTTTILRRESNLKMLLKRNPGRPASALRICLVGCRIYIDNDEMKCCTGMGANTNE